MRQGPLIEERLIACVGWEATAGAPGDRENRPGHALCACSTAPGPPEVSADERLIGRGSGIGPMEHRNGCTPGDVFGKIAWGTRAHRRAGTVTFPLTDGEGSTRLLALRNEGRLDAPCACSPPM